MRRYSFDDYSIGLLTEEGSSLDKNAIIAERGSKCLGMSRDEWYTFAGKIVRELNHWKSNHEDLKQRLAFATQRPDLPVDRIPAYEALQQRIEEQDKQLCQLAAVVRYSHTHYRHYFPDGTSESAMRECDCYACQISQKILERTEAI